MLTWCTDAARSQRQGTQQLASAVASLGACHQAAKWLPDWQLPLQLLTHPQLTVQAVAGGVRQHRQHGVDLRSDRRHRRRQQHARQEHPAQRLLHLRQHPKRWIHVLIDNFSPRLRLGALQQLTGGSAAIDSLGGPLRDSETASKLGAFRLTCAPLRARQLQPHRLVQRPAGGTPPHSAAPSPAASSDPDASAVSSRQLKSSVVESVHSDAVEPCAQTLMRV